MTEGNLEGLPKVALRDCLKVVSLEELGNRLCEATAESAAGVGIDLGALSIGEGDLEAEADVCTRRIHPGPIQAGSSV